MLRHLPYTANTISLASFKLMNKEKMSTKHCGLYCRSVYNEERLTFHDLSSNLYKDAIQVPTINIIQRLPISYFFVVNSKLGGRERSCPQRCLLPPILIEGKVIKMLTRFRAFLY